MNEIFAGQGLHTGLAFATIISIGIIFGFFVTQRWRQKLKPALFMLILAALILLVTPQPGYCLTDPCALLKIDSARTIMGEDLKAPRKRIVKGFAQGNSCSYYTSAPIEKAGGVGSISLTLYDPETMKKADGMFPTPKAYFERSYKVLKKRNNSGLTDVAGLGEKAYWLAGSHSLHVLAQGHYLVLKVQDTKLIKGANRSDLDKKLSDHRLELAQKAMKQYILPGLEKK